MEGPYYGVAARRKNAGTTVVRIPWIATPHMGSNPIYSLFLTIRGNGGIYDLTNRGQTQRGLADQDRYCTPWDKGRTTPQVHASSNLASLTNYKGA